MPGTSFYMGLKGNSLCFSTDAFILDYDISTFGSALKSGFVL
jgi:hypothetical protein